MFDKEFINCEYTSLTRESIMAARIFRERESKQTRACAAHDSAPLMSAENFGETFLLTLCSSEVHGFSVVT